LRNYSSFTNPTDKGIDIDTENLDDSVPNLDLNINENLIVSHEKAK
jgi:hypothetical protein